ncbi:Thiamine biosynthetic bifunctional enzyme [Candida viswanathii]|uniref:Thiamine biosynthetic bifunctional enzyme n=1 Tax=Candida viswanathii TaxID=5486 RepID=A0A367XVL2_9ASCO|nr:Thiamine biosynthetic bifunctional enzyme [Candida viswanathii]
MSDVDYTLYLVTDSTMIPESSTFLKQVEAAINNGATLVQLREKSLTTRQFIARAEEVHELTKRRGIPLIINDRVDVALAIDAEGVHVGQKDMPARIARQLIGNDKILGVTCSSFDETQQVVDEGLADYVGLGTLYPTQTKKDLKEPGGTGPLGIRKLLQVLKKYNEAHPDKPIRCVGIGGINHTNADKVLYQCSVPGQKLDGVAVVSCIMANPNAAQATIDLLKVINRQPIWANITNNGTDDLSTKIKQLTQTQPLVHHITNNTVKNFSANVTLAIGASPIMSELEEEYEEFASGIPNIALVLNVGTPTDGLLKVFKHAILMYNKYGKPILFDPVACGATQARLECSKSLLKAGQFTVIKGNVGEIMGLYKLTSKYVESGNQALMRGVDSIVEHSEEEIIRVGREVSVDFQTVVVISGVTNYIIDGDNRIAKVKGGNPLMGNITGTGCSLGSTIAAFLGAKADGNEGTDVFSATVGAVELYNKAGSLVNADASGSFMIGFIDSLYKLTH